MHSHPARHRPVAARLVALVTGLVLAAALAGCAEPSAADPASSASSADRTPERIVPLNGDIAEIVFALGLGDEVVAADSSATYPPEAAQRPKIGYQRALSAEGILSFQPTIVIGTPEAGPAQVIDQVRAAGVGVEIIEVPSTLDDVPARIQQVADLLGVSDKGREVAKATAAEIEAATAAVPAGADRPRVAFLYVRGTTTAMLAGAGSRADLLLTAAGAIDAGTEAGVRGFVPITPEALAAANPDVLLLLDAGLASVGGIDGLLQLPGVAQTPAGAARRIISLDDQYLLGLGPRTGAALTDLVDRLYA